MAKRFIDTNLFNDSWFMNLSANSKLFFIYLITNCDHAGIIDLNIKLAEFQTGIKGLSNSFKRVYKEFDNRLISIKDNYFFIPNFIKYQYPKGLNENVKAQKSVIVRLKEFELLDTNNSLKTLIKEFDNCLETDKIELENSLLTPQDKDIDKDILINNNKINYYREIKTNKDLKLTQEQYENLIKKGYIKERIDKKLDDIENSKCNKKYYSLKALLVNWYKIEYGEIKNVTTNQNARDMQPNLDREFERIANGDV